MILMIKDLCKKYNGTIVLNHLSFSIDTNQSHPDVLFYGPSGSGKTTLFRILMGLISQDAGTVELLSGEAARGGTGIRFGAVFQENRLCESFSAVQNLCMLHSSISEFRAEKLLQELLPEVAPEEFQKKAVRDFSGGQKRRISIARALLSNSDFLLFDEPFTGLDPETRHTTISVIYAYKGRRPLLLASHETEGLPDLRIIPVSSVSG